LEEVTNDAYEVLERIGGWANASATAESVPYGSLPTVSMSEDTDGNKILKFGIPEGKTGAAGKDGENGKDGDIGPQGIPGVGVPSGGSQGQVLAKNSSGDYDTTWVDLPDGGPTIITHPVTSVNEKTGDVVLTASDVNARPDSWTPAIDEIDGLQTALDNAGSVKTWNGIAPDENGNISAQVVDVDLSGSEESNGEPKKPLYALRIGGQLFYPVTSADQIILSNGEKLEIGGKLNIPTITVNGIEAVGNNITLTAQSVGALYIDEDGAIEDDGVVQTLNADTLAGMTYEQLKADIAQNIDIDIDPEDIGAATSGHTHTQYVETNSSPTFNVVTANKIIGAVYQ